MMKVQIPRFWKVKEVFTFDDSMVIICPDPMAGRKHDYSVIRIFRDGRARCIGRELSLSLSRKVAIRPSEWDGKHL